MGILPVRPYIIWKTILFDVYKLQDPDPRLLGKVGDLVAHSIVPPNNCQLSTVNYQLSTAIPQTTESEVCTTCCGWG